MRNTTLHMYNIY